MNGQQYSIDGLYRLSPLQQSQVDRNVGCITFTIKGHIKVDSYRNTWSLLTQRHSVLRTVFFEIDSGNPKQRTLNTLELPVHYLDWQGVPPEELNERVIKFTERERNRKFELQETPIMRLTLIALTPSLFHCVICYHRVALDVESIRLLCQASWADYLSILNEPLLVRPMLSPYDEYKKQWLSTSCSSVSGYWKEYLSSVITPTSLVVNDRRDSKKSNPISMSDFKTKHRTLSKKLSEVINSLVCEYSITINAFMKGAWALLLNRYSGEKKIVFGQWVSGRPDESESERSEHIVGTFNNLIPMRTAVNSDAKALPWLQTLNQSLREQQNYQSVPLSNILNWIDFSDDTPLFSSVISCNTQFIDIDTDRHLKELGIEINDVQNYPSSDYPLTLNIELGEKIKVSAVYDMAQFHASTIKRLLGHYLRLIKGIVANPHEKIGNLPLLTEPERQQILHKWNNTSIAYPQDRCVHQLFEEQVEKTPDAVAVVFEDQQLTYNQLNRRSNQLAHYLLAEGVGPEIRVGLCVERSLDMLVGLLGIVKAGGAYVPIDPTYPEQRLRYMVEHANIAPLLTQHGLSETHVCTLLTLEGSPDHWEDLPTLGKPIANERVYVLDASKQPVPVGVYGELYIGGVGIANGYLNQAQQSAERFIQNPLITEHDDRLKNPELIEVSRFFEIYNEVFADEKPLKGLPVSEWLQEIKQQFEQNEDTVEQDRRNAQSLSIYPLMMEAANARDDELKESWNKITNAHGEFTRQVLQQCGVHYPDIDHILTSCYWRFLVCSLHESISPAVDIAE